MSEQIPINFPKGGLSDNEAHSEQEPGTTREARNVRVRDPQTGQMRGAQRSGISGYITGDPALGTGPVRDLRAIVTNKPLTKYDKLTPPGGVEPFEEAVISPGLSGAYDCATDAQGNLWTLDSAGQIIQYNSDLERVKAITLPVLSTQETLVRRILVDELGGVYAASSNINGNSGQVWRYTFTEDDDPELHWTIDVGASVAAMEYRDGGLYVARNHSEGDTFASIALYGYLFTSEPLELWARAVPNPVNDIAVNNAGAVITAHSSNANRQDTPAATDLDASVVSWTPNEMTNAQDRIYGWWDASTLSGYADGDEVTLWPERRSLDDGTDGWVAPLDTTNRDFRKVNDDRTGPKYRAGGMGPGSLPTLEFDAAASAGADPGNLPGNALVTLTNTNDAYKSGATWPAQQAAIPGGLGEGGAEVHWATFLLVRYDNDPGTPNNPARALMAQAGGPANYGLSGETPFLSANHISDGTGAAVANTGSVTFNSAVSATAGATITIDDGSNPAVAYVFDSAGVDTTTVQNITTFAAGTYSAGQAAAELALKIANPVAGSAGVDITALAIGGTVSLEANAVGTPAVSIVADATAQLSMPANSPVGMTNSGSVAGALPDTTSYPTVPGLALITIIHGGAGDRDQPGDYPGDGGVDTLGASSFRVNGTEADNFTFGGSSSMGSQSYTVIGGWYADGVPHGSEYGQSLGALTQPTAGFNGHVCEMLTITGDGSAVSYNDAPISYEEIEQVEGYLAYKWGISKVLPSSHSHDVTSGYPVGTGGALALTEAEAALQSPDPITAKFSSTGSLLWAFSGGGMGAGVITFPVEGSGTEDIYTYGEHVAGTGPSGLDESLVTYRRIDDTGNGYKINTASYLELLSTVLADSAGAVDTGGWANTTPYNVGEEVQLGGSRYLCKVGHDPVGDFAEPGVHADWADYWWKIDAAVLGGQRVTIHNGTGELYFIFWTVDVGAWSDIDFTEGDKVSNGGSDYICKLAIDTPGDDPADTEPGTGTDWDTYWWVLPTDGAEVDIEGVTDPDAAMEALRVEVHASVGLTATVSDALNTIGVWGSSYVLLSGAPDVSQSATTTAATTTNAWVMDRTEDAVSLQMRMCVDSLGNLYVPQKDVSDNTQLVKIPVDAPATGGVPDWRYGNGEASEGYACAFPPRDPFYGAGTDHGPEFIYLVTDNATASGSDETLETIRKVRLLSVNRQEGGVRNMRLVGVSGGDIKRFTSGGTIDVIGGAGALASGTWVDVQSAELFGNIFYVDGVSSVVYTIDENNGDNARAFRATTAGSIPLRCRGITAWNGRLVMFRSAEDPNNWYMSAQGDPFNWDTVPAVPTSQMAVSGDSRPEIGKNPDLITAFIPYSDDLAIIGGDHTIHRMTGDPAAGGRIDLVSDQHGIAFGTAWAKDPEGRIYCMSQRGGVIQLDPGGGSRRISVHTIEERLRAVDQTAVQVGLAWNYEDEGLHIFQFNRTTGVKRSSWFWEAKADAWWEDDFVDTDMQPTSVLVIDGDLPADRTMLLGCEDGKVRFWDRSAVMDDGERIDSTVRIGPIAPEHTLGQVRFSKLETVLARDHDGARYEWFATDRSDSLGSPVSEGELASGRNPSSAARARGSSVWLRLYNAGPKSWAFESASVMASAAGRKRVRS